MKRKRIIIVVIIFFVIILGILIINMINKNELNKNKTINNILFSNVKIYKEKDTYYFSVLLSTDKDNIDVESIDIIILDKNANQIDNIPAYVGGLKSGENKKIDVPTRTNIKKAYSVNYVVYKK